MDSSLEHLLGPISEDSPCGPDMSYAPLMDEIDILLQGTSEVEIGSVVRAAEPPDWRKIKKLSLTFMAQSKHLRIAVSYCCASLQLDGLPGLRDGLEVVQHWLENNWDLLHPQLDPDDDNDPMERLNILRSLTAPKGAVDGGWLKLVEYVYGASIGNTRGVGPVSLDQLKPTAEYQGPDSTALMMALGELDEEAIAAQAEVVDQALTAVRGIDSFLETTLGVGGTFSFDVLEGVLKEVAAVLASLQSGGDISVDGDGSEGGNEMGVGGVSAASSGPAVAISGVVRNREDVSRALDSLCNYYRQAEPGSPVPFLLRRAQKIVFMDFVDAVKELNIANLESLRPSMGVALDADHGGED
jgi:type VI secretion system protein ImpA